MIDRLFDAYVAYLPWFGLAVGIIFLLVGATTGSRSRRLTFIGLGVGGVSGTGSGVAVAAATVWGGGAADAGGACAASGADEIAAEATWSACVACRRRGRAASTMTTTNASANRHARLTGMSTFDWPLGGHEREGGKFDTTPLPLPFPVPRRNSWPLM